MAARELLDDLATAGVRVWVEDGRLLYRAAPGALTADLKARVQALRADVVAVLDGRAPKAGRRNNPEHEPWPRHPGEQRVDRDLLEDVKAWKRWHPLPAFGDLMEAIALAWSKTKPQERDEAGRKVHHGASLKAEYERLAGWAYNAPEVVTADLPPFPFRLSVGQRVTGPAWLPALQAEIRRGAADPRVRMGVTLRDVQGLRAAIASVARVEEPARLPVSKKRRTA